SILGLVHHAHGMGLDGDAAFPLQIHRVEHLRLHLARGERASQLQQPISQRGFAVVDVSNNGEIAEKSGVHSLENRSLDSNMQSSGTLRALSAHSAVKSFAAVRRWARSSQKERQDPPHTKIYLYALSGQSAGEARTREGPAQRDPE